MKSTQHGVKVSILGREFFVGCKEGERDSLQKAATYLDKQMREVQSTGKLIGMDRCAIMAALNISHEFLELRRKGTESADAKTRVRSLQKKIEDVMQEQTQLTL
jgi:cell division protein ZapA